MKESVICGVSGVAGAALAYLFGGLDASLQTLLIFMLIDLMAGILTGLNGVSTKTEGGHLSSEALIKGLTKKVFELLLVIIGQRLDITCGLDMVRTGVCFSLIAAEGLSILENAGALGVPIPETLKKVLEALKTKGENDGNKESN